MRHDIEEPKVDSKYSLSYNRLLLLQKRFKGNADLCFKYNDVFEEQLRLGIIERVPTEVENNEGVEFIPHHGVVRDDRKTTKLGIIFDGSAKTSSDHLSLNDRLINGPYYVTHSIYVLQRFRCHQYALTADIEKAFLQIEIREEDREKLRFLWLQMLSQIIHRLFSIVFTFSHFDYALLLASLALLLRSIGKDTLHVFQKQ